MSSPWIRISIVAALILAVPSACSRSAAGIAPVADVNLTGAQQLYGVAPSRSGGVRYQPDVVVVGGGANAIRSRGADGISWTIKGDARGVDRLVPGKVILVTGFAVGRILAVSTPADGDRTVMLGPVNLTDVIEDADISAAQPISLDHVLAYQAPDLPGTSFDNSPTTTRSSGSAVVLPTIELMAVPIGSAVPQLAAETGSSMPPPARGSATAAAGAFHLTPFCCAGGVGVHLTYGNGGVRLVGTLSLHFDSPAVRFHLSIRGGKVLTADFEISGAAGMGVSFVAADQPGAASNVNKTLQVPVDLTVPILGLPIPFSAQVTQWIEVHTAFSAGDSDLLASGDYSFGGTLGFGYRNGSFGVHTPQGFAVTKGLTNSITGVSPGVTGLVLAYQSRFGVVLGAFGFAAGLYFMMTVSFGVTNGSSLGAPIARCRSTAIDLLVKYGIGWEIPQPVADLVNLFLRVFHAPPIAASGGTFKTLSALHKSETVPDIPICNGAQGG